MAAKRKSRRNMWPFDPGQALGRKTTYHYGRGRASSKRLSAKEAAKQGAARESQRKAEKLSDPDLERKLKAHYSRGGNLREFLEANPGTTKGQFARCVKAVAAKGGAYDPNAVCAAMERRKGYLPKGKRRRNPADEAAAVYEEFHGRPSSGTVEVVDRVHYHRNLAELGTLDLLVVVSRDGAYQHSIKGFKGGMLCCNEAKNQLFVRGGDQALNPEEWGFSSWPHEIEDLGEVVEIRYFTTKDHLGAEGGTAIYFHKSGTTVTALGKHKKVGYGPDLIYRTRDKGLEFAGGTYTIRAEGIDK